MAYPREKFGSGRIGFLWGGSIAGAINELEVTGRIDFEATARDIRKRLKGSRTRRR